MVFGYIILGDFLRGNSYSFLRKIKSRWWFQLAMVYGLKGIWEAIHKKSSKREEEQKRNIGFLLQDTAWEIESFYADMGQFNS